jgi:chromosome segregation ATPase
MAKCLRCGQEFKNTFDHDRSECRKQIIVGLSEQIQGQRRTIFNLGRKIYGQRKRLASLEQIKGEIDNEKRLAIAELKEELRQLRIKLEQTEDDLRIERTTRQESIDVARRDYNLESEEHKKTKGLLSTARKATWDANQQRDELGSQVAPLRDKIQELTLANKFLTSAGDTARKAETRWREEHQASENKLKALRDTHEELKRELNNRMKNSSFGEKLGETVLFYCGCKYVGKGAPVFCPSHLSPQTKEGLIDGR